jgi:hypothetical protein
MTRTRALGHKGENKPFCGYKAHESINPDSRMITSVDVVPDNANEIEAKFGEQMNRHGLLRARSFWLAKVTAQVLVNAITVNLKRAAKLLARRAARRREQLGGEPIRGPTDSFAAAPFQRPQPGRLTARSAPVSFRRSSWARMRAGSLACSSSAPPPVPSALR